MPSNPADDVLRSGSQFRLVGVVAVLALVLSIVFRAAQLGSPQERSMVVLSFWNVLHPGDPHNVRLQVDAQALCQIVPSLSREGGLPGINNSCTLGKPELKLLWDSRRCPEEVQNRWSRLIR
jgi:hypothetical protein